MTAVSIEATAGSFKQLFKSAGRTYCYDMLTLIHGQTLETVQRGMVDSTVPSSVVIKTPVQAPVDVKFKSRYNVAVYGDYGEQPGLFLVRRAWVTKVT